MARRQRTVRVGKPMPRKRAPTVTRATAQEKEPLPSTKEGVIEAMGKLCDEVDAQMASELRDDRRLSRHFQAYHYQDQPWRGLFDRRAALRAALSDLLHNEEDEPQDVVRKGLLNRETLGTPPSFGRPGFFVLWIDFIPIGCQWDGFIYHHATTWALDPDKPWVNTEGRKWIHGEVG